jgi:4-diphosphocytidyl-2-C-methyl-D-erythritol kinase
MTRLSTTAGAKLNLFLRVLGRRSDGFHDLVTCFHEIDLHDDLSVTAGAPGATLALHESAGRGLPVEPGADNLVLRAARAYAQAAGVGPQWHFELHKRIPAGAGLGGGSSDAAAALRLLDALHPGRLSSGGLHDVARGLGADVPFFLDGGTQIGTGTGTTLAPVADPPRFWFVLVLPPFGTSTAAVYEKLDAKLTMASDAASIPPFKVLTSKGLMDPGGWSNELEAAALVTQPRLANLVATLRSSGLGVRMSGSGSALFLACADPQARDERLAQARALVPREVAVLAAESASRQASARAGPGSRAGPPPRPAGQERD